MNYSGWLFMVVVVIFYIIIFFGVIMGLIFYDSFLLMGDIIEKLNMSVKIFFIDFLLSYM